MSRTCRNCQYCKSTDIVLIHRANDNVAFYMPLGCLSHVKYSWGNLGALYTQRVYYQDCTRYSTKITPNRPKGNTKKKEREGGREVEIGVKVSEELIYCTTAAKLYSYPAANINKHEFSSQNLSRGNPRSLRNNTSFLWILELQVTICNFCNYPFSRLDFLLTVFSLFL